MTLTGKIITVLIMILSLVYMVVAVMVSASHQNWQEKALALKVEIEELQNQKDFVLQDVLVKEKAIETEKVARMLRLQQLETQVQQAELDRKSVRDQLSAANVTAEEGVQQLKRAEARLASQDDDIRDLRANLKNMIEGVASQQEKVLDLVSQNNELEGHLRRLERIKEQLAEENAQWTKVARINGIAQDDLTSHIVPQLDGIVNEVGRDLIAINLGSDDGLRQGHRLDLYRNGRFVGTAEVTRADPNRSSARIDKDLTKIAIEIGDRVTSDWQRSQK